MDGKAAEIKLEGVTDPRRAGESLNRPDESKLSSGRSLLSPFGLASPALASSCAVRCPAGMVGRGKPCAALSDGWLNAPTKRLLLEERPFGRLSPQLSQIATPDFRTQSCPRGTLIADQRRACAARPKGKNEESPGWSLLRTERFEFFPATGAGGQVARATPSLIQLTFTSHAGSLLLSSLKKVTFPPFPRTPLTCTPAASPCEPRSCRRTGKRCRRWTARSADADPSVRPDKCNPSSGSWPPQWSAAAR